MIHLTVGHLRVRLFKYVQEDNEKYGVNIILSLGQCSNLALLKGAPDLCESTGSLGN